MNNEVVAIPRSIAKDLLLGFEGYDSEMEIQTRAFTLYGRNGQLIAGIIVWLRGGHGEIKPGTVFENENGKMIVVPLYTPECGVTVVDSGRKSSILEKITGKLFGFKKGGLICAE